MQNPIADIVANQYVIDRNSRIPFAELCGFYAALRWKAAIATVAEASGLDISTVAHLNAAGERRGGQIRYPKVRAEFDRLGLEKFSTTYLTDVLRDRLMAATHRVKAQRDAKSPFEIAGVQPRANKERGRHVMDDGVNPAHPIEIQFDRGDKPGWKWRDVSGLNHDGLGDMWRGDPSREERGFATSAEALAFCQLRYVPTDADLEGAMGESPADRAIDDSWLWAQKKLQK